MRWFLAPLLALSWLIRPAAAVTIVAPEIWFDPPRLTGWLSLFQDGAPWQYAARHVSVIVLEPSFVRLAAASDVLTVVNFAKIHRKKLALDLQAVQKLSPTSCGGIEGYSFLGEMAQAAQIVQNAGGQIDYFQMDEPVFFGHYDTNTGACQLAVPDLITRTATILTSVFAIFPNAQLIEIEPMPALTNNPDWRQTMNDFHVGLVQTIGVSVRTVQVDMNWDDPTWKNAITQLNTWLSEQNLGLGIIFNGTSNDLTDAAWTNHAVNNMETLEGELGIIPAQGIFMSWNNSPSQVLPETLPTSLTWLVDRYLLPRTLIEAHFVGQGLQGRLIGADRIPVAGATVQGIIPGVNWNAPLPVAVVPGIVPTNAISALIAIRINAECGCSGVNDVLIGTLQYQEVQGGTASKSWFYPNNPATSGGGAAIGGETIGGNPVTRVIALPGQSFQTNSPSFPVTANARYSFSVPATSVGGLGWFGAISIIWLGPAGELSRTNFTPAPGQFVAATAVTNPDGTFTMPHMPRSADSTLPVSVNYNGGGNRRAVTWVARN